MRYVRVTILHRPDSGQQSSSHFSYPELLGHSDMVTARDFAFRALGESDFQKGFVTVAFPQLAPYTFRFERAGLVGHTLVETQGEPEAAPLVEQPCG
jgi:hypothetical protein